MRMCVNPVAAPQRHRAMTNAVSLVLAWRGIAKVYCARVLSDAIVVSHLLPCWPRSQERFRNESMYRPQMGFPGGVP